jgi:hypothetical protein
MSVGGQWDQPTDIYEGNQIIFQGEYVVDELFLLLSLEGDPLPLDLIVLALISSYTEFFTVLKFPITSTRCSFPEKFAFTVTQVSMIPTVVVVTLSSRALFGWFDVLTFLFFK